MAELFLPQLSSKLPPTLPSLKPHWFREPVSFPLPCVICIYLHSTQVSGRGGGTGEAHSLFFFFFSLFPFQQNCIYLEPVLLLREARSSPSPTGDSMVDRGDGLVPHPGTFALPSAPFPKASPWSLPTIEPPSHVQRSPDSCHGAQVPTSVLVQHLSGLKTGLFWGR